MPVLIWCFVFAVITFLTFFFVAENNTKYSFKLCLIPILLFILPFLLREKTIENKYGVFESQITKEGIPFIVDGESDLVNLGGRIKTTFPVGTKIEVYTKIGKYVRFFYGDESVKLYRIVKEVK
jgi:hypothetical protein